MSTRYQEDGIRPAYHGDYAYKAHGGPRCQSIRGHHLDAAVAQALLAAVQPAELAIVAAALDQLAARAQQIDQQWQRRLERARYEANLAQRRFVQVDPDNRLVARTLEHDWNEKLTEVQRLEREYTLRPKPDDRLTQPEGRAEILALAQDLPRLWDAPTTTAADRKRLLRCLIKDVTLTGSDTSLHVGIRWQTEAVSELTVPRATQGTIPEIIAAVQQLAAEGLTDDQIATALHQAGWLTARTLPFTATRVRDLRYTYDIPGNYDRVSTLNRLDRRADGRYSVRTTAQLLNWTISTINQWCRSGKLDAVHAGPGAPYWIRLSPEDIVQLRNPASASQPAD
jgi:hypothetical protein